MRTVVRVWGGCGSLLALAACGGGGGGTPTIPAPPVAAVPVMPAPAPAPAPGFTIAPPVIVTGGPNDTGEYRNSTGARQANAIVAYDAGATGRGVVAAVIDGGIDTANPEFAGRISAASAATAGNGTIRDEGGHGTAVAGVLGAARDDGAVLGIAYDATLLVIRSDTPGTCSKEDGCEHADAAIARGVDIAVQNRARVINMSLGGSPPDAQLRAAIGRATAAGIVIVISAGNDAMAEADDFAQIANLDAVARGLVIVAGATDEAGAIASFSNRAGGAANHYLAALGVRLRSYDQAGAQFLFSGTSFSAPLVSGAVALLAQAYPNLTGPQIIDLLFASADDVGAAGVDAIYGRGRLNLVRAFQPRGATSVAGTAVAVSLSDNGTTSAPMGDAVAKAGAGMVILDSYGRAYALDLGRTLGRVAPSAKLAPALAGARGFAIAAGETMLAVTVARTSGGALVGRLALDPDGAQRARATAGLVATRIGGTGVALGFGQHGAALGRRLGGEGGDPFLVAPRADEPGFAATPAASLALRREIGRLGLTVSAERGSARIPIANDRRSWRGFGYDRWTVGADRRFGPLMLGARWSRLHERETLLGARFGGVFGGGGATSDFIDAEAALAIGGWRLGGSARRGRTRGAQGNAHLASSAFAADLSGTGIAHPADTFALRIAKPLRVEGGGFALALPVGYDYAGGVTAITRQTIGLAPQGRERDVEAAYTLPLGPGRLAASFYWRRDPGHFAAIPDDVGGALRWGFAF